LYCSSFPHPHPQDEAAGVFFEKAWEIKHGLFDDSLREILDYSKKDGQNTQEKYQ